jgi:mRNA-degrading endonuclease RelE of RelBE toxin-antitoxin system
VGDLRILYQVKGRALLVLIVRIGNRWEIYRRIIK